MKKSYIISGVVVVVLIVLIFVAGGKKSNTNEPIKIGIITHTTGNIAFLGENIVKSANLTLKEINKNKEYGDVEIIVEDIGDFSGNASRALSAFQKLSEIDGVKYIINGMSSDATMAIAPLIDKNKIVVVTPLTGGENVDNAAEYLFRNGPSDIIAGTKPAKDIYQFGHKKVAILIDNAEYTLDIAKHFREAYEGEIVSDQIVVPDKNDYRTEVAKLKSSNPDAIFIATATGVSAQYLIKQIGELGIKTPIFANFIAYGPDLLKVAGNYAENVYIYDPEFNENSPEVKKFLADYVVEYGGDPVIKFHSTGVYDALRMGLDAIKSVGYDGEKIHTYLLDAIKNWPGLNGSVTFDEKGNANTGFILKQIKNKNLILVQS